MPRGIRELCQYRFTIYVEGLQIETRTFFYISDMSLAVWREPGNWNNNNDRHVDFTVEPSAPTESDIMSESEDERMRLRYIGCRRDSSRNSDHIDTEIISDGCRPPLPFHQRPGKCEP